MSNPFAKLFGLGGQTQQPDQGGPLGNIGNLLSNFQQFKNNFKGNPEQIVQELRRSGKMSEAQFQQLSALANQLQNVMK